MTHFVITYKVNGIAIPKFWENLKKEVIHITHSESSTVTKEKLKPKCRKPNVEDGADVWKLIKKTKDLDLNSSYSYLMWCSYFRDTSVVLEMNDQVVGFISAFIKQSSPSTLFVWQVVVDQTKRGQGLASQMLHHLLKRDRCKDIEYIEATVSPSNIPSQRLFQSLAEELNTNINISMFLTSDDFPEEGHEAEFIHQIGPF